MQAQQIGNTMVMPGGAPQMMGMGEPMTGQEGFPLPYTPLKPFNQALDKLFPNEEQGAGPSDLSEEAITADEAIQILSGIQKLRGEIYLIGEIAKRGYTEGKVELAISNKLDKQTILNAVRETRLYGRITFMVVPKGQPPTDAIPVKGGANVVPEETQAVGAVA